MAEMRTIAVEPRDRVGKGSARAARRAGLVPAVIYGGNREPRPITVSSKNLMLLVQEGGFTNSLFMLETEGRKQRVLPRDIQLDPLTDRPIHVDFMRVEEKSVVTISVPVTWVGEEESPGLKRGGVLNVVRHEIDLFCPAGAIPESIEISLDGLDIGDGIHISAISLPEGATPTVTDRDFTIATIAAPSVEEVEEEAEEEEEEFADLGSVEDAGEDAGEDAD